MDEIEKLEKMIDGKEIACCIHLAWKGNTGNKKADEQIQLDNVRDALQLLKVLKNVGISRFIGAGTIAEREVLSYHLLDGSTPGVSSKYAISKLSTHLMTKVQCLEYKIEHIWCTIANVYGVGDKTNNIVNYAIDVFTTQKRPSFTEGNQIYDLIDIHDLVRAISIIAEKGQNNYDYFIGSGHPRPLRDYISIIRDNIAPDVKILFGEVPFNGVSLGVEDYNIDKIRSLGYEPRVTFEDGIIDLLKWRKDMERWI